MTRYLTWIVCACAAVLLAGCASIEMPGRLVVDDSKPMVVTGAELMPLRDDHRAVVVMDDDKAFDVSEQTYALSVDGREVYERVIDEFWVVDMVAQASGAVCAVREVELDDARRIDYDPPLPIIPAKLRTGEPVEAKSRIKLYDNDSGALQAEGEVTAVYTLLGRTDAGSEHPGAVMIQTDRKYRLPMIVIDMTLTGAYLPGEGPVVGRVVRTIKLLGLLPIQHTFSITAAE